MSSRVGLWRTCLNAGKRENFSFYKHLMHTNKLLPALVDARASAVAEPMPNEEREAKGHKLP
ncbi:MAG: hypothetical protein EBS44_01305 [Betaproteobacteria bacterium]|nr:hypothetical protein [Betaproteobacteria bacterium]